MNTGKVDPLEIERRIKEYQKTAKHNYLKGEYVKTAIKVCDCGCDAVEHMWLLVDCADKVTKLIVGTLANDPTHPSGYCKFGDIHVVSYDKIQEHQIIN